MMKIYNKDIEFCLNRAREATENYKLRFLGSDTFERSVDHLIKIAQDVLGKSINLFDLDLSKDDSPVWGACIAFSDTQYDICRVKDLNYCWARFITCKEVFHAIIDKDEYRNLNLCAHVDEVTTYFPDASDSDGKPSVQVMAERLAEIAAMEFLFPYERRVKELEKGESVNTYAIAERYRIPRVLVEKYLSTGYMTPLGKFSQ